MGDAAIIRDDEGFCVLAMAMVTMLLMMRKPMMCKDRHASLATFVFALDGVACTTTIVVAVSILASDVVMKCCRKLVSFVTMVTVVERHQRFLPLRCGHHHVKRIIPRHLSGLVAEGQQSVGADEDPLCANLGVPCGPRPLLRAGAHFRRAPRRGLEVQRQMQRRSRLT